MVIITDDEVRVRLSDENLREKFLASKSVAKRVRAIRSQLSATELDEPTTDKVLDAIMNHIIPAGTKGVIRGLEYNRIVKEQLQHYFNTFPLHFEEACPAFNTPERPDWWLYCPQTDRYVIGYNQVDLWTGGAQRNRANKYLSGMPTPANVDVLCVVSAHLGEGKGVFFEQATKAFETGRICYTSGLIHTTSMLIGLSGKNET